jgi:hypothetical protein
VLGWSISPADNLIEEVSMKRTALLASLVLGAAPFLFTPAVHAWHTYDPVIYHRFQNQENRIDQGIASGRLTPSEAARLSGMQARIRHEEMLMKADGRLTGRERFQLHHDLNHSSRAMNRMKHNGRFAY